MLAREIYTEEHEIFRRSVRRFMDEEIAPNHEMWEEQGYVDRDAWRKAGELGILCMTMPEEYGGFGVDQRYSALVMEELARVGASDQGRELLPRLNYALGRYWGLYRRPWRFCPV